MLQGEQTWDPCSLPCSAALTLGGLELLCSSARVGILALFCTKELLTKGLSRPVFSWQSGHV